MGEGGLGLGGCLGLGRGGEGGRLGCRMFVYIELDFVCA